jgi:hypothetical protein
MNHNKEQEGRFRFGTLVLWCVGICILYLLSSGPVTRWFPKAADTIYAPLTLLAHSKIFAKALLAWLHLWGVDTGG